MSGGQSGIPEPVMPEHNLLRGAAPQVRLSAGLRQQVLTNAVAQYHLGRRQRLLSRAGVIVAAGVVRGGCVLASESASARRCRLLHRRQLLFRQFRCLLRQFLR